MAEKNPSYEETLALINVKAKELGDNFQLKVLRKRFAGGLPELVANLADASVAHIINPETWLPRLAGGGPIFVMQVYHAADPNFQVGAPLQVNVPTDGQPPKVPSEIDIRAVKAGNWKGPATLLFPTAEEAKRGEANFSGYSVPSSLPPAAPVIGSHAANLVPVAGMTPQPGAISAENAALLHRIQQEREQLERTRAELAEEKHRNELNELRRESDQRMKDFESRITAVTTRPAEPKTDLAQMIATLAASLTPLLVEVFKGQDQMKMAMLKSQEQTQAQTQMILLKMLDKPKDDSSERMFDKFERIMEKSQATQVPQTTMLHSMMEAMSTITNSTLDLAERAADLNMGGGRPDDHPALKAIKEGVKAVGSLMQGYQGFLPPQAGAGQLGIPGTPPPQLAPAHAPQPGAPVVQPAAAAPTVAPPPGQQRVPGNTTLEQLENAIKMKLPVDDVARAYVQAIATKDASVLEALDKSGGDPAQMVTDRLGAHIMQNPDLVPYLNALSEAVNKYGEKAGIFESSQPQEEDDSDDDYEAEQASA